MTADADRFFFHEKNQPSLLPSTMSSVGYHLSFGFTTYFAGSFKAKCTYLFNFSMRIYRNLYHLANNFIFIDAFYFCTKTVFLVSKNYYLCPYLKNSQLNNFKFNPHAVIISKKIRSLRNGT